VPESLQMPDGTPVDIDDEGEKAFNAAMAVPEPSAQGEAPDYPAPRRRRDPDAPFGFEEDGKTPKAPYGLGANGKPRQNMPGPGRGGKKHDKPRVQPASRETALALPARDYSAELGESLDGLWAGLAFLPPTQAQATILKANKMGLVGGLNLSAQHNPYVRRGVEYFCSDASWMINAAMMIGPFALQSAALWFRPSRLETVMGTSAEELAAIAQADFKAFVAEQEKALAELLEEARAAEQLEQKAA